LCNEIQANYIIKGGPLGDNGVLEIGCTLLLFGDVIHLSKSQKLRWGFLWEPSRRVYQSPTKFEPLILPFDGLNKSLIKNMHLQTLHRPWLDKNHITCPILGIWWWSWACWKLHIWGYPSIQNSL